MSFCQHTMWRMTTICSALPTAKSSCAGRCRWAARGGRVQQASQELGRQLAGALVCSPVGGAAAAVAIAVHGVNAAAVCRMQLVAAAAVFQPPPPSPNRNSHRSPLSYQPAAGVQG